jgi:hypothetical protein
MWLPYNRPQTDFFKEPGEPSSSAPQIGQQTGMLFLSLLSFQHSINYHFIIGSYIRTYLPLLKG